MRNYLKNQKAIERKPKSKLVRTLIALGLISLAGIGADIIAYAHNNETIFEKRVRYLNIANEQMLQTQNPEEINGLNAVIKDIEKGAYDYKN